MSIKLLLMFSWHLEVRLPRLKFYHFLNFISTQVHQIPASPVSWVVWFKILLPLEMFLTVVLVVPTLPCLIHSRTSSIQLSKASNRMFQQFLSWPSTPSVVVMSSTITQIFLPTSSHSTTLLLCNGSVPSHNCSDGKLHDSQLKEASTTRKCSTAHKKPCITTATPTLSWCLRLGIVADHNNSLTIRKFISFKF